MSTMMVLAIILLVAMIAVGGMQGLQAFISLIVNFGVLFFGIVLISYRFAPIPVVIVISLIMLAVTIFFGGNDDRTSQVAFYASVIVLFILILVIMPVENWAQVQGFGAEDSEDLEGMSLLIGVSYLKVASVTAILSTLGAIAEAAMAIAAGLAEILEQHPKISTQRLFKDGIDVGKQIIGTTFNTLFFGFFGGFLALFIWFAGVQYSLGTILNDKIFVAEVLMILFAMLAVLLTVPLTTWVMVRFVMHERRKEPE